MMATLNRSVTTRIVTGDFWDSSDDVWKVQMTPGESPATRGLGRASGQETNTTPTKRRESSQITDQGERINDLSLGEQSRRTRIGNQEVQQIDTSQVCEWCGRSFKMVKNISGDAKRNRWMGRGWQTLKMLQLKQVQSRKLLHLVSRSRCPVGIQTTVLQGRTQVLDALPQETNLREI